MTLYGRLAITLIFAVVISACGKAPEAPEMSSAKSLESNWVSEADASSATITKTKMVIGSSTIGYCESDIVISGSHESGTIEASNSISVAPGANPGPQDCSLNDGTWYYTRYDASFAASLALCQANFDNPCLYFE